jgi:hypothetical protein
MLSTALSKILAAKAIAVIAAAAAATGGVALAAQSTGAPADRPAAGAHATTGARPSAPTESGRQDGSVDAAGQSGKQSDVTTDPSIAGLCHAWAAGATDNPGKAVESPAFAALVTAAGDPDAVPAYCADLPETTAPGKSGSAPGRSDASAGNSGSAPGHSDTAPGRSGSTPGQSDTAPGRSDTAPGHSDTAPGQVNDDSRPDHTAGGADDRADDKSGRPADAHKPAEKPDRSGGDIPREEKTAQR